MTNLTNLFDLSGRTAIVTGGGGILGRGFCAILAAYGARVALVDVNLDAAQAAANEIASEHPQAELLPLVCDIADPDSVAEMVDSVCKRFGDIHILHNNAASKSSDLAEFFAPVEDYRLEQWREIMSVNLDGLFLVAQAVGRHMVHHGGGGSIIQTSSIYGVVGPDPRIYEGSHYLDHQINTPPVYAASKAAVIGLTKYLSTYWGSKGIRVNTLTPGGVESGQNETFVQKYSQRVPLGRMARASEMQAALLFLASDASSYVTGQNIIVDGGFTAW